MAELTELTAESLGRLRPAQLVELLRNLDPDDPRLPSLDIDALGRAIDPRKLRNNDLVSLLTAITRLATAGARVDLRQLRPKTFAAIMTTADKEQVDAVMAVREVRETILDDVFRRMSEHVRADRTANTEAVVHWRITGGTGKGGFDRYETVISHGHCEVNRPAQHDPRATITIGPAEFLTLATGNGSAPVMFMTGKLRVKGDLGFAAGLSSLFNVPRA